MSDSIIDLLDQLPSNNLTVKTLNALDFVVPGEWENVVGFDKTIEVITGETDADRIMDIRNKAIELYNDADNGYQGAIWYYNLVDNVDGALAAAAMAEIVSEKIPFLSFLGGLTPKADTTQSIDLCLKIVAELIAYSKLNGLPILNPGEFVTNLTEEYSGPSLMRMAALVCLDGLIPLGPDFLQKVQDTLDGEGESAFADNAVFGAISDTIPGDDKFGFISETFGAVQGWMDNLVGSVGLTPESIFDKIGGFIDFSDDALDVVAAFLDKTTNYFQHTGTQSVARKLIQRAAEEA
ncbi:MULTISPECIES: hypothetical protein [Okeania]|uniref:Uncharacterized protein n=1 Tax=Okeania hirsuta TaxID=1458930 RepID=A0A3N6R9R8_9CYAN|nr:MULTISPECIES: hypothetical protein [Okeania]NET11967.1 hypothetical protein [Okeania sp. SIO1H6]NES76532.1 hypothetical protein [Okeania sp. SIO1H4]NES91317.1 hypothetical protein [Okeania sp. SIO2B9]NET20399.1 hypothetical protein [Okeania sp. SIO1H5]NET77011.1 hypothetical protein [Okeania sp. SIO1F9]